VGQVTSAPLRAVIFDYGHTLMGFSYIEERLLPAYEEISSFLSTQMGREFPCGADLMEKVSKPLELAIKADYETGSPQEMDIASTYERCFADAGHPIPLALLEPVMEIEQRAWNQIVELSPHTIDVLEFVRGRGLKIGICSNVAFLPRLMLAQMKHVGVDGYFDHIALSSATGWRKPHEAIYQQVLEGLGVRAEEALYVGDRMREDVRGPKSLGMRAVLTHEFRQEAPPGPGDPPQWHRPDHVISSLSELPPIIDSLLARDRAGEVTEATA
jgi:putative hydrolase of the HAD superfamily